MKIIVLPGEIFEFPSFFFCLKIPFNVNRKATKCDTPLVRLLSFPLIFVAIILVLRSFVGMDYRPVWCRYPVRRVRIAGFNLH